MPLAPTLPDHQVFEVVFQPLVRSRCRAVQLAELCLAREGDPVRPPNSSGAYVFFTPNAVWPRMRGGSPILKIGSTHNLAREMARFNNKAWVTNREIPRSVAAIMDMQVEGRLDAFLMSHLWHLRLEGIEIALAWHPCPAVEALSVARSLLAEYLEEHSEVPPANMGSEICLLTENFTKV